LRKILISMLAVLPLIFHTPFVQASVSVSAKAAIVVENSSGKVLFAKNADERLPMASTTKIMTAICTIENTRTDSLITVADEAVGIEGSSIYLAKDEKITVRDLLYGMMLNSGNDAATALAIETSGSVEEFARLMNETAKRIGAKNTNFVNACGLYDDNHYTTAYDLALITSYALKNPLFAEIVSSKTAKITNGDNGYPRVLRNHNKLLNLFDGCIGVKTGYTKKCGRCLVSAAERDGVTLTCVTLNAPDDWNDHTALLNYGFSKTKLVELASQDSHCMGLKIQGSASAFSHVVFGESLSYVAADNIAEDVKINYSFIENLKAPLNEGEVVGKAELFVSGVLCDTAVLVCSEPVPLMPRPKFGEVALSNIKSYFSLYSF